MVIGHGNHERKHAARLDVRYGQALANRHVQYASRCPRVRGAAIAPQAASAIGRGDPMSTIVLEPAARDLTEAFSKPPFLYQMEPAAARQVLDDAQAAPIEKLPVDEEWITVPAPVGEVRVRIVKPPRNCRPAPGRRLHAWRRLDSWQCRHS